MADPDYSRKVGDLLPPLRAALQDGNGNPIDLSDALSVKVRLKRAGSRSSARALTAAIDSEAGGLVRYDLNAADTETAGTFSGEWVIEYAGGNMTVPSDGTYFTLVVSAAV